MDISYLDYVELNDSFYEDTGGIYQNLTSVEEVVGPGRANFSREDLLAVVAAQSRRTMYLDSGMEILLIALYSLLGVVGLVGNGLVCAVVLFHQHMKTPRNMYILLLAASDISICVILIPLSLLKLLLNNWPLGPLMCQLYPVLTGSNIYISTLGIMAMAISRYQTIVGQASRDGQTNAAIHRRQMNYSLRVVVGIVLIAFALSAPLSIYSEVRTLEPCIKGLGCFVLKSICVVQLPHWQTLLIVVTQYLLPLLVLSTTNTLISRFLSRHQCPAGTTPRHNRFSRVTSLLLAITLVFFVTWLPWNIFNIILHFSATVRQQGRFVFYVSVIFHLVALSSACSNPILYGLLNNKFRKEFVSIFRACFRQPRRGQ